MGQLNLPSPLYSPLYPSRAVDRTEHVAITRLFWLSLRKINGARLGEPWFFVHHMDYGLSPTV